MEKMRSTPREMERGVVRVKQMANREDKGVEVERAALVEYLSERL